MTYEQVMTLVMAVIAACSLVYAFSRNKKQDVSADVQIKSDVGYIKNRIDEMIIDQKAMSQRMGDFDTRLVRCDESCKQAHKRIDEHLSTHPTNLVGARRKTRTTDEQ